MNAMLGMKKIEIAELERAGAGDESSGERVRVTMQLFDFGSGVHD